ncbi:MAG: NAD-dependent epimerase/dehydratase family protein [Thermoanaerobaculia bacterium]
MSAGHTILVTGGCGFIGSHLVDRLVADGQRVRVIDALEPQVHGDGPPPYLNAGADYTFASLADRGALATVLEGADAIFHLAASVGVGQSMYEIERYVASNTLGTAKLLEYVMNESPSRPAKLVVASSMSVYGEGAYACPTCGPMPGSRRAEDLDASRWEPRCAGCGAELVTLPTRETKPIEPTSVYALTKYDQERLCLSVGAAYEVPVVALRFFNVYGPRQALSNPYTGVAAIFSSRIKAGRPPVVYEDGRQRRDFVSVHDVVAACLLALDEPRADGRIFNVGSGRAISVLELGHLLLDLYGRPSQLEPEISGTFRQGDIRHCFADITALRALGYEPAVDLATGLAELAAWAESVEAEDRFAAAQEELAKKGLL